MCETLRKPSNHHSGKLRVFLCDLNRYGNKGENPIEANAIGSNFFYHYPLS